MFRKLKASEIDVRIQSITEKGAVVLLYKDARVDMNMLDETVGNMNWKREHTRDNQNCIVSIWNEKIGQWVSKEDTGTESNTEKEKGLASDSFKRACTNWGIGRELYTAGFIFVKASDMNIIEKNGKYATYDKFSVKEINYDSEGTIEEIIICNQKQEVIFKKTKHGKNEIEENIKEIATEQQKNKIKKLMKEKGISLEMSEKICEENGEKLISMTKNMAAILIKSFEEL